MKDLNNYIRISTHIILVQDNLKVKKKKLLIRRDRGAYRITA